MRTIRAATLVVAVISLVAWQTAHGTMRGQAYAVSITASTIKSEDTGPETSILRKGSLTTPQFINAMRGRDPGASVPANERLALELIFVPEREEPYVLLAVYDTVGQTNLAVAGLFLTTGTFEEPKGKGFVAMVGEIDTTGIIAGGWLSVVAKASVSRVGDEPVLTSLSGNLQGVLEVVEDMDTAMLTITKGKLVLTGTLGPVNIDPD